MLSPQLTTPTSTPPRHRIPLWLKLAWTLLTVVTIPSYWAYYSFAHTFLWFSDVALILTCVALWRESPLLAGSQAVGVALIEIVYTVDFFVRLTTGVFLTGLSVYFFQGEDSPMWVRSLSLFHLPLPFLLLWMLWRLGYDRRALLVQTALAWVLLPTCYFFTNPADNVNWVYGPRGSEWDWMPEWGWLVTLMVGFPVLVYLPSHWLFCWMFASPRADNNVPDRPM